LLDGRRENREKLSDNNWCPGQYSNRTRPGHESGPLTLRQRAGCVQEFRRRR
jgi:hypothetical protein